MVFHESSNTNSIMEEISPRSRRRFASFLMKKLVCPKFLIWCVLQEVQKILMKIMLNNDNKAIHVNWDSSMTDTDTVDAAVKQK
jgi:hypothetical protein